ncbi:MAG: GTP-binding protein [Methanomicrobiales archaeon]|nr:GTP-binding protein [Methanomicrobiales archaeon]
MYVQMEDRRLKIVVFGTHGAGKSTFIQCLDPQSRHIEALEDDSPTTVSMDFVKVVLFRHVVYLFGTPGQERFEFVRNILSRGMDGAIIVVDATRGVDENTYNLCVWLKGKAIPFAVMANKCDCEGADPRGVAAHLDGATVHAVSARVGTNVIPALETFVRGLLPKEALIP